MIVTGRAVVVSGDNIDTDVLYPGEHLNVTAVEEMRRHLFDGLDPSLRDLLVGDTILIVGANFGAGSSREHVPQAMKASGVRALVGESFARIFYRNCINLGLPAFVNAKAAAAAKPGSEIEIDTDGAIVVDAARYDLPPLPPFMQDLLDRGGLENWVRARGAGSG